MKATSLLENQHRKVQALFKKLQGGRSDPYAVLDELAGVLVAHMAIEQEILYPRMQEVEPELVSESYEEHALAEVALKRLIATDAEDEAFEARVSALKDLIDHHLQEEEQQLFPKADTVLDEDESARLARSMKQRFDEVLQAGFASAVPKGMAKTSADVSRRKFAKRTKTAA